MTKMAALGPRGTFCEIGSNKYIDKIDNNTEVIFYPTITKVFNAINKDCEIGIIPIENTLDGYVQLSLDLLSQASLNIAYELFIPIQFACVGNVDDLSSIEKVYVQFKSQGQCLGFLEKLDNAKIIITESNGESFEQVKKGGIWRVCHNSSSHAQG